jgi:hypothetical protein
MIFALLVLIVVAIAFHEVGLAAIPILAMTIVALVGILAFIGMITGNEASGEIFLWCAAIVGGYFAILWAMS